MTQEAFDNVQIEAMTQAIDRVIINNAPKLNPDS